MTSVVDRGPAGDGTDILVRHWAAVDAWATVLLVHGLGEHSGRYEHVGAQMATAGLDVHAYDQRGNGGSSGPRGHVERWSHLQEDLAGRLLDVRAASKRGPLVLYGHSLGGLLVLGYLLTERPKPDLAVLSAPGLDSTLPGWKKALAPILGKIAPTLRIPNGVDGRTLSRDASVASKLAADPDAVNSSSARFGAESFAEQARVRRDYASLTIPTLVIHGLDDGLVPETASVALGTLPYVERRTYPGLRHELHNEPEGPVVIAQVIDWIRDRARIQP
ncbi:MAG: alpha/beta hydrolase [Chloroflexi bacterium]|nr:alpha/beta hydrolase [Chloroflexota bacterium]